MTKPAHASKHLPLTGILFTLALVSMLTFSTHVIAHELSFVMLISIVTAVALSSYFLPGSLFFTLALANIIAVYASFFVIILDSDFRSVERPVQWIGFISPLLAFFIGTLVRHKQIRHIINSQKDLNPADYAHALLIMLPLSLIAIASMAYAGDPDHTASVTHIFIAAMAATSLVAYVASRDVVIFLLITGKLFESFFQRMTSLIAPIFAFFTFYSFTVMFFAALYAGIDLMGSQTHFRIMGDLQEITFPQAIYFSLVTLATVGYGDIVPASNLMRLISSFEVICGVMLLLFGFNEILSHTREHHSRRKDDPS